MSRGAALILIVLTGCGPKDGTASKLMETGWFSDTGLYDAERCTARFGGSTPEDGVTDWYHRNAPSLWVEKADPDAYDITLVDDEGIPAPVAPTWDETGLKLAFELAAPLKPDTDYHLTVSDCAAVHEVGFRTSTLGLPLEIPLSDLIGRTYHLDLLGAEWVAPGGADALIDLYFGQPALVGVQYADTTRIDLLGAAGDVDAFGKLFQAPGATWDFPTGSLDDPYFVSTAALVVFVFDGVEIPIHNARLAGTFSTDADVIGGGELSGLGDTRDLGAFLPGGGSDPNAICALAAGFGVQCQDCPDGEPYCLYMEAYDIDGDLVEGLRLIPKVD